MDTRNNQALVNLAAQALPKLASLTKVKFIEWFTSSAEVEDYQEEYFYDEASSDIYIALSLRCRKHGRSFEKTFVACAPLEEPAYLITTDELIERDLVDITHLTPAIAEKVTFAVRAETALKSALKTSIVLNCATC